MSKIAEAIRQSSAEELLAFAQVLVDSYAMGVPEDGTETLTDASAGDVLQFLFEWATTELAEEV